MADPIDSIYDSNPNNLAELLQIEKSNEGEWSEQEIEQIMQHQLQAPLAEEIARIYPEKAEEVNEMASSAEPAIESVGELLRHPSPPLELLKRLKEASKAARRDTTLAMPVEVPTAIYFTSIGTGLVKNNELISTLDAEKLQKGLAWTADQKWLDEALTDTLRQAEQKVKDCSPGGE